MQAIAPLRLRILLEQARRTILNVLNCPTWEHLVRGPHMASTAPSKITHLIHTRLRAANTHMSHRSIRLINHPDHVRQAGNLVAHNASRDDIRDAVMSDTSQDSINLREIFRLVYGAEQS